MQEDEEETKRQEVLKAMSRPGTVGPATPTIAEPKEEGKGDGEEITVEGSDQELKKLMQQTDDAKVIISLCRTCRPLYDLSFFWSVAL